MTLIKSISGIRGTIGGQVGDNLTAIDIVACTSAYAGWINNQNLGDTIVVGRDARISGEMVSSLVIQTLRSMGLHVVDIEISTTPTVEMAVQHLKCAGGIIITASHNPKEWNALKFLNHHGEFISAATGSEILRRIKEEDYEYAGVENLGGYQRRNDMLDMHLDKILSLDTVDQQAVRDAGFQVAVDCINSSGAIAIPALLNKLNCNYDLINEEMHGDFAHNPEPLEQHLVELTSLVQRGDFDLGIVVDPDVDRLAFVSENGQMFGEEYTIVAIADYLLSLKTGNTVSNLSSTQALKDVTQKHGGQYFSSAVGEVNVVSKMKEVAAVFGGEGNGGVIYPELHYGRDALVGIALFLTLLAKANMPVSKLRATYPSYTIVKKKVSIANLDPDHIIETLIESHQDLKQNTQDGLKLYLDKAWVHIRKSNTEPILRIYAESQTATAADQLADEFIEKIQHIQTGG